MNEMSLLSLQSSGICEEEEGERLGDDEIVGDSDETASSRHNCDDTSRNPQELTAYTRPVQPCLC